MIKQLKLIFQTKNWVWFQNGSNIWTRLYVDKWPGVSSSINLPHEYLCFSRKQSLGTDFPNPRTAHYTRNTKHGALHTVHFTLHNAHYTLFTTHYTLNTVHWTLHTLWYGHCTLYSTHGAYSTIYCRDFILPHTAH